jgi:hypothetical protein
MKKTILILLIMTIISLLCGETIAQRPAGNGSAKDPFMIENLSHLRWLSETPDVWGGALQMSPHDEWMIAIEEGISSKSEKFYFLQKGNINASETRRWNGGEGFRPIGEWSLNHETYIVTDRFFTGSFDGGGYIINNLYIAPRQVPGTDIATGMWGATRDATITGVRLHNAYITSHFSTGALVGCAVGTQITRSQTTGTIFCIDYGFEAYNNYMVGGLVGSAFTTHIEFCSSTINITGAGFDDLGITGGLVGGMRFGSLLRNSFFHGRILRVSLATGGLVGLIEASHISHCYVASTRKFADKKTLSNNRLIRNIQQRFFSKETRSILLTPIMTSGIATLVWKDTVIEHTYWDTQTTGISVAFSAIPPQGSQMRESIQAEATGLTTAQMKKKESFVGWDWENVWRIDKTINGGVPFLR